MVDTLSLRANCPILGAASPREQGINQESDRYVLAGQLDTFGRTALAGS
jgi:hypothetical protein